MNNFDVSYYPSVPIAAGTPSLIQQGRYSLKLCYLLRIFILYDIFDTSNTYYNFLQEEDANTRMFNRLSQPDWTSQPDNY
jgi:hypothetical protein